MTSYKVLSSSSLILEDHHEHHREIYNIIRFSILDSITTKLITSCILNRTANYFLGSRDKEYLFYYFCFNRFFVYPFFSCKIQWSEFRIKNFVWLKFLLHISVSSSFMDNAFPFLLPNFSWVTFCFLNSCNLRDEEWTVNINNK